jgi:chromosome segregation ATPase
VDVRVEADRLRERVVQLHGELRSRDAECAAALEEAARVKGLLGTEEGKNKTLRQTLAAAEARTVELKALLDAAVDAREAGVTTAAAQVNKARKEVVSMKKEVSRANAAAEEAIAERKGLVDELDRSSARVATLEQALFSSRQRLGTVEKENRALSDRLQAIRSLCEG